MTLILEVLKVGEFEEFTTVTEYWGLVSLPFQCKTQALKTVS